MPINSTHPEYDKMLSKWKRCEDVASGQDAVHAAGVTYLPKLSEQSDAEYEAYKLRAGFFNATWRALSSLVGLVLRVPPRVEVPAEVEDYLDDIDLAGVPLYAFAQTVLEEALKKGRVGVFVDSPPMRAAAGAQPTRADAIIQNIRPALQLYNASSIINWRTATINNVDTLTLVVLKEVERVPKDEWEMKAEDRWRELALVEGIYRVRIFKRNLDLFEQVGRDVFPTAGGALMEFIPFIFIGTDDLTTEVDDPPLIDLVDVNLAHYRVTADYEHGCHFTGLPTAVVSGYTRTEPSEKLYLGSTAAWVFPDPAAHASFLEFSGQGLQALVENLNRKEQQMAVLGARMLEPQKKAVEAADTASIHRKGEESLLATVALTVGKGIEQALQWMTAWAGANSEVVEFEFNRDFYPVPMSSTMLATIMSAWQSGMPGFSDQEVFAKLQKGDMISGDTTLEEEQARIADRQIELAGQAAAFNAPPADTSAASSSPQPIIIQMPKGNGKRTVTGPTGQKYTIEEGT